MTDRLRLAVLLSGTGRTLENLLAWRDRGELLADVVCVASNRAGIRGIEIAEDASLPARVFRLRAHGDRSTRDAALFEWVRGYEPDLVLLAGYLALLDLAEARSTPVVNIHPSLLPRHGGEGYYGHRVHEAVLAAGDVESGCTVHRVDEVFDRGAVLAQARVPVLAGDDADRLAARVFAAECVLYPETVNRIARGEIDLPVRG